MNWKSELLDLYEKNSAKVGVIEYKHYRKKDEEIRIPYVLSPPFHTTVAAQIEVRIDQQGNFVDAALVNNEDKLTIIPVTEKSGSRTAGIAPHPLCDNLLYVAGDYGVYVAEGASKAAEAFALYMAALEEWHLSEYTHKKIDVIYDYLCKRELIKDLVESNILLLNEEGKLDKTRKLQNVDQCKAFVRFVVRQGISEDILEEKCWLDRTLQERFIEYYRSITGKKDLDYLTGRQETPSYLHPKKIRNEGDGAKLISSNDETDFTFLGRFLSKEQAFAIGGETSWKIHNALKWIIRKQGTYFDTFTIVVWESHMWEMPAWNVDTETISSRLLNDQNVEEDEFTEDIILEEETLILDENSITAEQFYSALKGYQKKVENTSRMVLMAFDAATTGRLALAEYKSLDTGRYLKNIERWHTQCGWLQQKFKDKKIKRYYGVPGVAEIAELLYGSDAKGFLTIQDKNGKRLYANISMRLLPCIWDGRSIPYDLVMTAVTRASNPQCYKENFNWERVLMLACSFVKKHRFERKKEEWNLALNKDCRDRSYLYGRLLAVADRVEYRTYDTEKDSGRVTNAKRYMSAFAQRPFDTWKIIEENIQPYFNKLKVPERRYYENRIDEICQLFEVEGFRDNSKLDGLYLLGFHSQSHDLKNYKKEETREEEK